ncbi:Uncharacterised protein [Collinsella intestinalis]|nr:Uncharacterised protein [Collinsella intestinalis]
MLELGCAFGVDAYGHDCPGAQVILHGYCSAGVFNILLDHGQACARASDIALLLSVGACDAELECALFISDTRSLVGKADGVAVIQDGDDGF